ncbi:hypothetical protein TNCV_4595511 [Trichonephila clavipes]|uniref:Uncharacterized protein n=1 Tax=Trichonephila clavipes TaxID=2585209 RepID=A0A8X7BKM1_TRICX|nr:hypothetical protein TNCV_4595511 [Trichonephila clavipes]
MMSHLSMIGESSGDLAGQCNTLTSYRACWVTTGRGKCVTLFGGVRGTPRNSSSCKQQQGRYTNYCCNPYGKAAPHHSSPLSD